MTTFTISREAIYSLHRLSQCVATKTGFRCKLSQKEQILKLLRFASITRDGLIQAHFLRFLNFLSIQQLKLLASKGIKLPGKAVEAISKATAFRKLGKWLNKTVEQFSLLFAPKTRPIYIHTY